MNNSINRTLGDANYGTHMVPLINAVVNTKGDVFEMGCGDYSTPLLHYILTNQKRNLLSSDTDLKWLNLFKYLENDYHKFEYVKVYDDDWELNPKPSEWDKVGNKKWSVVFIDHRPGDRRKIDIERFKNNAEIIVIHDTETLSYGYEPVISQFKYQYVYKVYKTYTTLVSNFIDVEKLFEHSNKKEEISINDNYEINQWQKIDTSNNLVFPWYSFEMLDELKKWDTSNWNIFEYGGGLSTLWWRDKSKNVVSIDSSKNWCEKMDLIYVTDKDKYIEYPLEYSRKNYIKFDCIIIDGEPVSWRDNCMHYAIQCIKPGGYIIIDNWKQNSIVGLGDNDWSNTEKIISELNLKYKTFFTPTHPDWKTIVIKLE